MSLTAFNDPEELRSFYFKLLNFKSFCLENFNNILKSSDALNETWKDEQYIKFIHQISSIFIDYFDFSHETDRALNSIHIDLLLLEDYADIQKRIKQEWIDNRNNVLFKKDDLTKINEASSFSELSKIAKQFFENVNMDEQEIDLDIMKETLIAASYFKNKTGFKKVPITLSTQSKSNQMKQMKQEIASLLNQIHIYEKTIHNDVIDRKVLVNDLYRKQLELHQYENDCYAFYCNSEMTLIKNIYIDIVSFHNFLTDNVNSKFHPIGCDSIKSIYYHEIGHFCVDFLLHSASALELNKIKTEIQMSLIGHYEPNFTMSDLNNIEYSIITEKVSEYAAFSEDELIAEIISEYLTLNEDSRLTAKIFGKKLIQLVRKTNERGMVK